MVQAQLAHPFMDLPRLDCSVILTAPFGHCSKYIFLVSCPNRWNLVDGGNPIQLDVNYHGRCYGLERPFGLKKTVATYLSNHNFLVIFFMSWVQNSRLLWAISICSFGGALFVWRSQWQRTMFYYKTNKPILWILVGILMIVVIYE